MVTAYVMKVVRKELIKRGESVLMKEDNALAVQWVLNYKGGKDDVSAGDVMRIPGTLEGEGRGVPGEVHGGRR